MTRNYNTTIFIALLKAGADPNARDNAGRTPMDSLSRARQAEALMLAAGGRFDDPTKAHDFSAADLREARAMLGMCKIP